MNKLFRYYVWQGAIPSLVVLAVSLAILMVVFIGVSRMEVNRNEYPGFLVPLQSLWQPCRSGSLSLCGEGITTALTIARWGAFRLRLSIPPQPSELELQIPVSRVVATNIAYICGIVLVFYPLKSVMTVIE